MASPSSSATLAGSPPVGEIFLPIEEAAELPDQPDEPGLSRIRQLASSFSFRLPWSRKFEYTPLVGDEEDVEVDAGEGPAVEADEEVRVAKHPTSRRRRCKICSVGCGMVMIILLLTFNAMLLITREAYGLEVDPDDIFHAWGQTGTGTEGLAWYPTDFLRDVTPIPCHSHNDYWRRVPLFSALHAGCIGVEADVWLVGGHDDLYVGHNRAALQPNRTFQSLYVDPLVDILSRQNTDHGYFATNSSSSDDNASGRPRGVFDTAPDQTLILMVDIKTKGPATFRRVLEDLEPLRARGWLTTFVDGEVRPGPITVVGSGRTPFDILVANSTYRDVFYDAPLERLKGSRYNYTNSYYSSVAIHHGIGRVWFGVILQQQRRLIQRQLREAHDRGLQARYWDLPLWPIGVRNSVWDTLVNEGVDLLNVDDLRGATQRDWSEGGWL